MLIGDLIRDAARRDPDGEALVHEGQRLTWRALNLSANRLANGLLAIGVKPGDRVGLILGNTPEIVQLYFALAKIGCVSVPIMPRSVAREIAYILNDVEATAILATAEQSAAVLEALSSVSSVKWAIGVEDGHGLPMAFSHVQALGAETEPEIVVDPDSIYSIQFTSGTTGAPKGCILTHKAKVLSRMSMLTHVPYEQRDRALLFMPLTASLGADMLLTHVLRGMTTVLMSRFDEADMLRLIEQEKISVLYALESTFDRLVVHEDVDRIDWSSLRYFFATSATRDLTFGATRLQQAQNFRARFWNAYGCTEGGGWLTFLSPGEIEAGVSREHVLLRSIGRECMLARVDCVGEDGAPLPEGEIGEMVLCAPWLFSGYWRMPEKSAEALRDGRYFTGDLARKNAAGYVFLEGRMKDMIKTGGINVYPAEIELVLKAHPNVREVAVIGVPDSQWGEKVIACIIAEGDREESELASYCKRELAGFKVPKTFAFMDDFPRDIVGKILKRELRALVIAEQGAS